MAGPSREPLRIGILGAARIAALALVDPAHATGDRLVAVAARDRGRAEAFAASHGGERVVDTYADVVADPEVEVVYNPLANGLHGPCNVAAIAAGKQVLTEKPSASNASVCPASIEMGISHSIRAAFNRSTSCGGNCSFNHPLSVAGISTGLPKTRMMLRSLASPGKEGSAAPAGDAATTE